MRVPIPVVILLCLCVIGGVWWAGTRKHDFLSPPTESELALIRQKNGVAMPPPENPLDVNTSPQSTEAVKPILVTPARRHQNDTPQLTDYRNQAVTNPALLAEMARQLETQEKPQRSLLAWERIIDSAAPDAARTAEALQAIKRLRVALPPWNIDPAKTIAITLHAGTGKSNAEALTPVLEAVARDLEQASSGILKINPIVTAGHDVPKSRGPAPIALWLSGAGADANSTQVLAFTSGPPETLRDNVLKTLIRVIRSHLARTASLTVPEADSNEENPLETMNFRVTRLGWMELGSGLNKTLE